jgi:hypothetical protein
MGDDASSSPYKSSFMLTAAKLNLTDPLDAKLMGVYLYVGKSRAGCGCRGGRLAGHGGPCTSCRALPCRTDFGSSS